MERANNSKNSNTNCVLSRRGHSVKPGWLRVFLCVSIAAISNPANRLYRKLLKRFYQLPHDIVFRVGGWGEAIVFLIQRFDDVMVIGIIAVQIEEGLA